MKKTPSVLHYFFWLAVLFAAAGCGDSRQNNFVVTPPDSPAAAVYSGKVMLGRPVSGATVIAKTVDGVELTRTTSSASGSFLLQGVAEPRFRVEALSESLNLTLAAEVDSRSADDRYLVLNAPTTVVSRFMRANPGESLAQAESRFRSSMGIQTDVNLGYGIEESVRSPFSHLAFFVEAANSGGFEALVEQLVSEMGTANQGTEIAAASRFHLTRSTLNNSFAGLPPELVEFLRVMQGDRTLVLGVTSDVVGKVLGFVGEEAATSVLDAGIDTGWTKFAEQIGFNFGTTVALDHIQDQLDEVLSGITDIENQISDQTYQNAANALTDDVAFIEALSTDGNGTGQLQGGIAEPYGVTPALNSFLQSLPSGQPTDEPLKPTSVVNQFIGSLLGFSMAQSLTAIADSQENMNALWRKNKVDNVINTSTAANQSYFPVRSNYWIDQALQNYNYYSTFQEIAANWLVETARQNNQLADGLNGVLPTVQSVAAALRRQRGQLPYYQISDNLLVDLNAGLIWSLETQGPMTYDDAVSFASSFKVQGTSPIGNAVTLDGFRIPTHEEVEFLRDRARYCTGAIPSNDTPAPANSDSGVGDYGRVTQGLQRLGFKDVNNVFSSSDNGGDAKDGGVWYRSWKTPWDSTYLYRLSKGTEIQLNHESGKEAYKNSKDKRPFLICRQIFSVRNNVNEPGGAGGTGVYYKDTPAELQTKTLPVEFYPSLGVISRVKGDGAITYEKWGASLAYTINTGHPVTIGGEVSRNAGYDDQTSQYQPTHNGSTFNAAQTFVWFTTPTSSPLTVSNYPPAFPSDDENGNPLSFVQALNEFGTAGTLLWATSDRSTTNQVAVTTSAVGYDGTNFPAVLSSTATLNQTAVNNQGQPRQPKLVQISPRNRVYDSTFSNSPVASETYGLSAFFDNKTVDLRTNQATWELVNLTDTATGAPYTGGGLAISNVAGDVGLLQVTLASVPVTGVDFEIKATVVVDGQTLTDTVSARAIGTP